MGTHTDELMERVLRAAADLSNGNIERIVSRARADAEAEVQDLLKSAIKAAMLQRALSRLENSSSADIAPRQSSPIEQQTDAPSNEHACYVYCVTAASQPLPSELNGNDGLRQLRAVSDRNLQAIFREVPLAEFGPMALDEHSRDPAWVERNVRVHDEVVKAAMLAGPVIPLRFCTVLRDERAVGHVLEEHHDRLRQTLESLQGAREWGVKIRRATGLPADSPAASGSDYLRQQSRHLRQARTVQDADSDHARQCHNELSAIARQAVTLPAREPDVFLNAAYLVAEQDEGEFHALVAALSDRQADHLDIQETGPWPPYNFVNLDLSLETAQ